MYIREHNILLTLWLFFKYYSVVWLGNLRLCPNLFRQLREGTCKTILLIFLMTSNYLGRFSLLFISWKTTILFKADSFMKCIRQTRERMWIKLEFHHDEIFIKLWPFSIHGRIHIVNATMCSFWRNSLRLYNSWIIRVWNVKVPDKKPLGAKVTHLPLHIDKIYAWDFIRSPSVLSNIYNLYCSFFKCLQIS